MDALEAWGGSKFDRGPKTIGSYFQRSGIYVFLISFACVYYLSNAPLLLGHYDLGWHLAAGDLIRERGNIPFQDPWSFTLGDRQWYNLSWLWDVIASAVFQYTQFSWSLIICSCMWRSHSRISYVHLPEQRSLGSCSLHFRFFRVLALPRFCDGPKYLSRRFAKHFHHVVLRNFLRRMLETERDVFCCL